MPPLQGALRKRLNSLMNLGDIAHFTPSRHLSILKEQQCPFVSELCSTHLVDLWGDLGLPSQTTGFLWENTLNFKSNSPQAGSVLDITDFSQ